MGAALLLAATALLTSCSGASGTRDYYFASYVDASSYRPETDEAALERCAALDGADRQGQNDSYPPSGIAVTFSGSDEDRKDLEDCLRSLSNVRVIGSSEGGRHISAAARRVGANAATCAKGGSGTVSGSR